MFKRSTSILICALLLLACVPAIAQPNDAAEKLRSFARSINSMAYLYPQERAYLHFDNTGYYVGETMWFQAYVVSAATLVPANLSKVLYVELLSPKGDVIITKKLKIEHGRAAGEFVLNDMVKAGYHEVRAYTRAMLNFGADCIFSRVLPIFPEPRKAGQYRPQMPVAANTGNEDVLRPKQPSRKKINVSFYPEGGTMVCGLPCRVAFKATDEHGENIDVAGKVYDANGNVQATFATRHDGMGMFALSQCRSGMTAVASYNGREHRFALPACSDAGFSLRADVCSDSISVRIANVGGASGEMLGVGFACRGMVYVMETFTPSSNPFSCSIAANRLPTGVVQVSLFNTSGTVLAERMVFVRNPKKELRIAATRIGATFEPYSPINIELQASDSSLNVFSLSVRDRNVETPCRYYDNATSSLLLSSEMKGLIERPAWYFDGDTSRRHDLDLLMMVQAWRRCDWQAAASKKPFVATQPMEKQLFIEGRVLQSSRNKALANVNVEMWMLDGEQSLRAKCVTDTLGFTFPLQDIYNTWRLSLRTLVDGKPKNTRILIDRQFSPAPRAYSFWETNIGSSTAIEAAHSTADSATASAPSAIDSLLAAGIKEQALNEVTVVESRPEMTGFRYASKVVYVSREVDKLRDVGKDESGLFIDFLRYSYNFREGQSTVLYYNDTTNGISRVRFDGYIYNGRPVLFVINNWFAPGQPLASSLAVSGSIPIEEILTDEVKTFMVDETGEAARRFAPLEYTNKESFSIVFVYTGKRREEGKGMRVTTFAGFSRPQGFYSPSYEGKQLPDEPDLRRTLLWQPFVVTDTLGRATVRLFNSATCKAVSVDAQGI